MGRGFVRKRAVGLLSVAAAATVAGVLPAAAGTGGGGSFVGGLHTQAEVASTIPANGDVNPYGVAIVPRSQGNLDAGNVLVSNFNNAANKQGTGTTIVEVREDPGQLRAGRSGTDHRAGGAALGMGDRRQPADL